MAEPNGAPTPPTDATLLRRPIHPARAWALGLAYWAALWPATFVPRHSGNVWSRYMTIESLVERGTPAIERSSMLGPSGSPDVVRVDGHTYSDKPPVLSTLSALVYAPLWFSGWRFSGPPPQFVQVNLIMVTVVVGLASASAVVAMRLLLQCVDLPRGLADVVTLALAFSSQLFSYAVTFNNHSVAAGLIAWAFALVALERPGARRRRGLAGLLAGLAATIDLPAGCASALVVGIWLGARARRVPLVYLSVAALPWVLHAALQLASTGSPLPVEMTPDAFHFAKSYWITEAGRARETVPRWLWGVELLLGPQGWLTVTPLVALGLAGMGRIVLSKRDPLRPLAASVGFVLLMLLGYYTWGVRRIDFAGLSFGTRHLLAVSPLCLVFAVEWLSRWRYRRTAAAVFAVCLLVGGVYACEGMIDPWSRIERRRDLPLVILQRGVLYPWSSYQR
jgi:hypothetical protein